MKTLEQASIVELKAYIFDLQTNTNLALQVLRNKEQAESVNSNLSTLQEQANEMKGGDVQGVESEK